ncbi:hypothetical protein PUNSTDRAFT_43998 [Punctularia strigosozonata HHB-11173 SS5]|uniref:uncharacterized protein n=1 Tax=Punctularia strigosozonata (strain HHB-11173) TaxID=741275 RepID=UPI000441645D|nr:uncharacterized protein PUNSTDRAFT_43998 [Punctularia strigosozonata HHB-11173 SS5]EIN09701.1 hypothetical protein PUNSTDRAFT_43998 [Punctularia strigosozonata HHB-11173 SS5]
MPGLDSLPQEVLEMIFSYVCTEGGYMGTVLSRVSKFIRLASARNRFQTLWLAGELPQLEKFAKEIARADQRKVLHKKFARQEMKERARCFKRRQASLGLLVRQILKRAGPTLKSLALIAPDLDFAKLYRDAAVFPRLTDLTLHYQSLKRSNAYEFGLYLRGDPAAIHRSPPLYTVRRLHLFQNGCGFGEDWHHFGPVFQVVRATFPAVEYMRLSGVGPQEDVFPAALRAVFGVPLDAVMNEDKGPVFANEKRWLVGPTWRSGPQRLEAEVEALKGVLKTLKRLYLQRHRTKEGPDMYETLRWLAQREEVKEKLVLLPIREFTNAGWYAAGPWFANALGIETCYTEKPFIERSVDNEGTALDQSNMCRSACFG